MSILSELLRCGVEIKTQASLAPYTYIKIGGPAEYLAIVDSSQQLIKLTQTAIRLQLPFTILGGGSNVLISDHGIKGLVIINHTHAINIINDQSVQIRVDSGMIMNRLVNYCIDQGYGNLEEFLGIPGTLGGAIVNNSHHLKHLIGDYIESVHVINHHGESQHLTHKQCQFKYDFSIFQTINYAIISATINLTPDNPQTLRQRASNALKRRRDTQPLSLPSSGCMFKNIGEAKAAQLKLPQPISSAGYLLDQAGLKGLAVGDAQVSDKHANFIINRGQATAADVQQLSEKIIHLIKQKYHITLEKEVFFIGE